MDYLTNDVRKLVHKIEEFYAILFAKMYFKWVNNQNVKYETVKLINVEVDLTYGWERVS